MFVLHVEEGKMCSPLRGKIEFSHWKNSCFRVKDVKSALEFYKKYRDCNFDLEEWKNILPAYVIGAYRNYDNKTVNNWLFDYCFGDVIE